MHETKGLFGLCDLVGFGIKFHFTIVFGFGESPELKSIRNGIQFHSKSYKPNTSKIPHVYMKFKSLEFSIL